MANDLLLEIGATRLPATFVLSALERLPRLMAGELSAFGLGFGAINATGSARRLVVRAQAVRDGADLRGAEQLGPSVKIAFDADGDATVSARNFARKFGLEPTDLYVVERPSGQHVALRAVPLPAVDALPGVLRRICERLFDDAWPQQGAGLRAELAWICAAWGAELVPFEFAGVSSALQTRGAVGSNSPVTLANAARHATVLLGAKVCVDLELRRERLLDQLTAVGRARGLAPHPAPRRLFRIACENEWPEVSPTALTEHAVDLPLAVASEALDAFDGFAFEPASSRSPDTAAGEPRVAFLVVEAGTADASVESKQERARVALSEAAADYHADLADGLSSFAPQLSGLLLHPRLGSVADKVERLRALAPALVDSFPTRLDPQALEAVIALCKCAQPSRLVRRYPELAGRLGQVYAEAEGQPPHVATAIAAHTLDPEAVSSRQDPAACALGAFVGMLDHLDTLVAAAAFDLLPVGNIDPLGVRYGGVRFLRALLKWQWSVSMAELIRHSQAALARTSGPVNEQRAEQRVLGFLRHRLRAKLLQTHSRQAVEAAWPIDAMNFVEAAQRVERAELDKQRVQRAL
jgi:glycyl-tRNA synthetase beta chain